MELLDAFVNGDVELRVYRVGNDLKYWLRCGAALLEFDEERLVQMLTLLYAFVEEDIDYG